MGQAKGLQILPRLLAFTEKMAPTAEEMLDTAVVSESESNIPSVTIRARTSRPAYSPVMTTVLRRCHLILVMDSRLSQRSSITCKIVTHS